MQRHKFVFAALVIGLATLLVASSIARADDVTDWNQHMLRAGTVCSAIAFGVFFRIA